MCLNVKTNVLITLESYRSTLSEHVPTLTNHSNVGARRQVVGAHCDLQPTNQGTVGALCRDWPRIRPPAIIVVLSVLTFRLITLLFNQLDFRFDYI